MWILFLVIATLTSIIGAISGIGGGIILKPVLDGLNILSVTAISFLSSCTVLSMSLVAIIRNIRKEIKISVIVSGYLALGSCIGGVAGKVLLNTVISLWGGENTLGLIQHLILLGINIVCILYIKNKQHLLTKKISNPKGCLGIGFALGLLASFLGIGGGPINIGVLCYFFSMRAKEAAINSLFIIFFSQMANIIMSIFTRSIPSFAPSLLIAMCFGGVLGALIGSCISARLNDGEVESFFFVLLIVLGALSIYNILRFAGSFNLFIL